MRTTLPPVFHPALAAPLLAVSCLLAGCDEEQDSPDQLVDASSPAGANPDAGPLESDAGIALPDASAPDAASDSGSVCFGASCDEPSAFRPEPVPPTDALIAGLEVPEGFVLNVFARDLQHARMLATHGDWLYLTRPRQGDVLKLTDSDADGVSDVQAPVASGLMGVHGIVFHEQAVYLATPKEIYLATVSTEGTFSTPQAIITDLPDGGQHLNRTLGIGPDGLLYISVGSSCDACEESNPEHATMLRAALDGSERSILARGLRNTLGFAWHPETKALWGMDQGSDWRGDDLPPEELNQIEGGKDYGWPYCFGERQIDPIIEDPPTTTKQAYCAATTAPVLVNQAHGSPIAFAFYQATSFPAAYRNGAFLTLRGSWNRSVPTGYKVVHVRFEDGQPTSFQDFVTGFLVDEGRSHFGRVAGLTVAADGALLFSDDENGYVYRVQAAP
jgi:glucose/arabinose dehydrogenase